jgi:hypothetical protein
MMMIFNTVSRMNGSSRSSFSLGTAALVLGLIASVNARAQEVSHCKSSLRRKAHNR